MHIYPIGTLNSPWQQHHYQQWRDAQSVKRSYAEEVLARLPQTLVNGEIIQYGALSDDEARYPLYAAVPNVWQTHKPSVLVTGGVHGYETSGVQGALDIIEQHWERLIAQVNLVVLPCISPWGYETINRWNPEAVDPNRSFKKNSPSEEARFAMQLIQKLSVSFDMHIDLHETTNSDNTEFRPALAAKEGRVNTNWNIPDGFYLVADSMKPALGFQQAIIQAVAQVTHIAPADEEGMIIGAPLLSEGVIGYDKKALYLCAGMTQAPLVTTTEVYPDSPKTHPAECNLAQVTAVNAGVEYLMKHYHNT